MDLENNLPPADESPSRPLVVPSANLLVEVHYRQAPTSPPPELTPFVVSPGGTGDDWHLTEYSVAWGGAGVLQRFAEWRDEWIKTWSLDPVSHVQQLLELERTHYDGEGVASDILESCRTPNGDAVVTPADMQRIVTSLNRVADKIRSGDGVGIGLVDATPGRGTTGLIRAWPAATSNQLIAADDSIEVRLAPGEGIRVTDTSDDTNPIELGPIKQVHLGPTHVTVTPADGDIFEIPDTKARALSLLAPGSARWKIREIPEILSWARTLSSLPECAAFASEHDRPARFTTRRPISASS